MFDQIIQIVSFQILLQIQRAIGKYVKTGNPIPPDVLELVRLYFDIEYLARHGIPPIPPEHFPPNFLKLDSASLQEQVNLNQEILFSLLNNAFEGDPNPQPSIKDLLGDTSIRLASAKNMLAHFERGIEGLNREISRLELEQEGAFVKSAAERLNETADTV